MSSSKTTSEKVESLKLQSKLISISNKDKKENKEIIRNTNEKAGQL